MLHKHRHVNTGRREAPALRDPEHVLPRRRTYEVGALHARGIVRDETALQHVLRALLAAATARVPAGGFDAPEPIQYVIRIRTDLYKVFACWRDSAVGAYVGSGVVTGILQGTGESLHGDEFQSPVGLRWTAVVEE
ncbi:hypothetical protein ANO11243_012670 [Dothideomycetidae sp. 11243]|nr:hypothetical protein ANO11243_012670 [fungal sp. No.11243]